jgi:hypothetical protein
MKKLFENWRGFITEQKDHTLLNEGSEQEVILWMEAKVKAGMSLTEMETLINEVVSEISRRGFLKGLMGLLGVAAAGAPGKALAAVTREDIKDPPERIVKYIRGLFEKAKQAYSVEGIAGRKTIKDFADVMDTSEDVVKGFWPKVHQRFALALDNMLIKMMPLESDDTQAVVHSKKDDDGVLRPVAMVLNPKLDWSIGLTEPFPRFPKDTPATVLQHEAEHAIEKALIYASIGKLEPVRVAGESLDTVFDMSGGDSWADDPDEVYAEFRALRTRLGGKITKSDLDNLCKIQCNDPEAAKIPPERRISDWMIPKLRCRGCSFDNSKRGVDGANYFAAIGDEIDAKINTRGKGRTMIAEYVVPMGYSLKAWKAHRKKHKITNAQWHKENPGRKWKVVHGHKKGEIGEPVNDKATNMSYEAANKMHAAIAISQGS